MSTPSPSLASMVTSTKGLALLAFAVVATIALLAIGRSGSPQPNPASPITGGAQQSNAPTTTTFSAGQEEAIRKIVKTYLVQNPQVLVEAGQALEQMQREEQATQAKKVLSERKVEIFRSKADFVYGNPKGDITIVEYFDYNCGWCKRALDEVIKLATADPKVRIVLKEFPVFGGPPSVEAAKAAMASMRQGKYWDYHVALMRERRVGPDNIYTIAEQVGLDVAKLKADMADPAIEATLQQSVNTGRVMGMEATPGFLIDSRMNVGFLAIAELQSMVAEIRKAGCEVC